MATTYKKITNDDIVTTKTLLHEAIPLTGAIVSGTYSDNNIKDYAHGMFQSVYDYPYLSSSANHVFDITVGYSSGSWMSSSAAIQNSKKINIYTQMAQSLMGYDVSGNVQLFDEDGDLGIAESVTNKKIKEAYFINLSRLLTKDEIKKGSFALTLGLASASVGSGGVVWNHADNHSIRIKLADTNAQNDYRVNSAAGEYGILYATEETSGDYLASDDSPKAGLIFYQAGVIVLTASVFRNTESGGLLHDTTYSLGKEPQIHPSQSYTLTGSFLTGSISGSADGLRARIYNMSFNNTTELNSQIYFCRINHNEFNYSSNPTYLSSSKIRVKTQASDNPVSYITTIGLYNSSRELLAVGKLSEPLKNDPTQDMTLRVRLDF